MSDTDIQETPVRARGHLTRRDLLALLGCAGALTSLGARPALADGGFELPVIKNLKQEIDNLGATFGDILRAFMGADYQAMGDLTSGRLLPQIAELRDFLEQGRVKIAEGVTDYGPDIEAARILLDTATEAIETAFVPMVNGLVEQGRGPFFSRTDTGGAAIDLDVFDDVARAWSQAEPLFQDCLKRIEAIEGDFHIDKLANLIRSSDGSHSKLYKAVDVLNRVLPLVPPLLGSRGPRSYLVVAQANSEVAATGGFPGAMGFATLDGGRFDMGEFGSVWDVLGRQESPLPLSDEELALYGEAIGFAPDAMGHNPDFPRAAELWALSCAQANGFSPAGVVALDPVFLQDMLALVGASVPTSDGTSLDGGNAARELLSDVYWRHLGDYDAQDAFFGEAASGAAEAIMEGLPSADPGALLGALAGAFEDRRLNLWLADPDEQAVLERLDLDNGVAGSPDKPELGVFLSDASWAKLEWYLRASLELGPEGRSGGARSVPAALTLENTITQDEVWAAGGDTYIVGSSELRRQDGDMVLELTLYAPVGGSLQGLSCDGGTVGGEAPEPSWGTHLGRGVAQLLVRLLPGESSTVRFEVALPEGCEAPLEVDMTPLAQGAQVSWKKKKQQ